MAGIRSSVRLLCCRAAANCYCQLLASQSDNNVKLIVLDRLQVRIWTRHHLMTHDFV